MNAGKLVPWRSNRAFPLVLVLVLALAPGGCDKTLRVVTTHADEAEAAARQVAALRAAGRFDDASAAISKAVQEAEQAKAAAGATQSDDIAAQLRRAIAAAEQARINQAVIAADQRTRPQMAAVAEATTTAEYQEKVIEVIKGVICDCMDEVDSGDQITWDFLYTSIADNVQKAAFGEDERQKLNDQVEAINSIWVAVFNERTASNAAEAFKNAYCDLLS